jgi:hypothetical protein
VQNGIIRTNCIDCLDRTNAAAFVIGKCALSRQLVHLGIIKSATIPFDTEAVDLLTELYQAHGDAIALQYGGSALVNTMKTYRTPSDFVSQSRDTWETIKRFYNNSFTDSEKQDAIDIFLGVYRNWNGLDYFAKSQTHLFHSIPPAKYTLWRSKGDSAPWELDLHSNDTVEEIYEYIPISGLLGRYSRIPLYLNVRIKETDLADIIPQVIALLRVLLPRLKYIYLKTRRCRFENVGFPLKLNCCN